MTVDRMSIFGVAVSFNLFGEGLRDAPGPTSSQ